MEVFVKNTFDLTYEDINKPVMLGETVIGFISDVSCDFIKIILNEKFVKLVSDKNYNNKLCSFQIVKGE